MRRPARSLWIPWKGAWGGGDDVMLDFSKCPSPCQQGALAHLMILLPTHLPTLPHLPLEALSGDLRAHTGSSHWTNDISRLRNTVSLKKQWRVQQQGAHTPGGATISQGKWGLGLWGSPLLPPPTLSPHLSLIPIGP